MNKPPDHEPGYLEQAMALAMAGNLKPGTLARVIVEHQTHCAWHTGGTACTCHPQVTLCGGEA